MSNEDLETGKKFHASTADYRKYPKGPNFNLIVALTCVTLLVLLFAGWLLLRTNPRLVPKAHGPLPAPSATHASPQ
jgi:hypothetical protein